MPSHPLVVSVIYPIQLVNQYTNQALATLLEQSYEHIEIIAVWYGDENLTPEGFLWTAAKTFQEAVNAGLKRCTGDFVTFLMPYDYYSYQRIEKCIHQLFIEKQEFLFTKVHAIDEDSDTLFRAHSFWQWKQELELQADLLPTLGFTLLKEMAPVTIGNVIISKRVADHIGHFTTSYEYLLMALLLTEPIFLKEELYFYRIFSFQHEPFKLTVEANTVRQKYLLSLGKPPENKLAPCHHYWPMTFSSFRFNHQMDASLGEKLHALQASSLKEFPHSTLPKKSNLGKVTILIHDFSLSGAPKVAADLAFALKEKGYEPIVISFSDGALRPFFEQAGIATQFISPTTRFWFLKKRFRKGLGLLSMLFAMFKKSSHTTIAVASLTWPALFVAAFFLPYRKFIWYLHDSYSPEAIVNSGISFALFRKCLQRKNLRFWFGSHATREIWETAQVHGEVVYWSGIAQNTKKSQKKTATTILSVGAGYPRKGAHFLIDAFIQCVQEKLIPEYVHLVIVGFSDTLQDLKDFVSDIITKVHNSECAERIQLVKSIDEDRLSEFYENCDLYVQPSFLECLPLAMLKAMSQAIPVITTHVDGCNEAIQDGINGFTCPPRNSTILAKKIAYAINHYEEACALGKKGQETFNQKFSLEETKEHFFSTLAKNPNTSAFTEKVTADLNKKTKRLTELV